jgi:hypothetical protein
VTTARVGWVSHPDRRLHRIVGLAVAVVLLASAAACTNGEGDAAPSARKSSDAADHWCEDVVKADRRADASKGKDYSRAEAKRIVSAFDSVATAAPEPIAADVATMEAWTKAALRAIVRGTAFPDEDAAVRERVAAYVKQQCGYDISRG